MHASVSVRNAPTSDARFLRQAEVQLTVFCSGRASAVFSTQDK